MDWTCECRPPVCDVPWKVRCPAHVVFTLSVFISGGRRSDGGDLWLRGTRSGDLRWRDHAYQALDSRVWGCAVCSSLLPVRRRSSPPPSALRPALRPTWGEEVAEEENEHQNGENVPERTFLSPTSNGSKGNNTGGKGRKHLGDPGTVPAVGVPKGFGLAIPKGAKGSGPWRGYHPGRGDFKSFRSLNFLAQAQPGQNTQSLPPVERYPPLQNSAADDPRTKFGLAIPKGAKGSGPWRGYHPGRDDLNSFQPLDFLAQAQPGQNTQYLPTVERNPPLKNPAADDPRTTKARLQTLDAIGELEAAGYHVSGADAQAIFADLRATVEQVAADLGNITPWRATLRKVQKPEVMVAWRDLVLQVFEVFPLLRQRMRHVTGLSARTLRVKRDHEEGQRRDSVAILAAMDNIISLGIGNTVIDQYLQGPLCALLNRLNVALNLVSPLPNFADVARDVSPPRIAEMREDGDWDLHRWEGPPDGSGNSTSVIVGHRPRTHKATMDILLGSSTYKDHGEANRATLVQNYKGDDLELDELCEHPLCLEPATDLCAVCEPAPGRDVGSFFRTEVEDVERAARDAVEPGVDPLIDGPVPSPSEWLVGPPLAPGVD